MGPNPPLINRYHCPGCIKTQHKPHFVFYIMVDEEYNLLAQCVSCEFRTELDQLPKLSCPDI